MSLFTIFQIASQGMSAQRQRLEASSQNLANANSTRTPEGTPYQRRDVVFSTEPIKEAWRSSATESGLLGNELPAAGVKSETVIRDDQMYSRRYDPGSSDADKDGYVLGPNVDPLEETVNMMSAARSFEANATVFNTAKDLARVSINLGD